MRDHGVPKRCLGAFKFTLNICTTHQHTSRHTWKYTLLHMTHHPYAYSRCITLQMHTLTRAQSHSHTYAHHHCLTHILLYIHIAHMHLQVPAVHEQIHTYTQTHTDINSTRGQTVKVYKVWVDFLEHFFFYHT